jgi:hypothetical protein
MTATALADRRHRHSSRQRGCRPQVGVLETRRLLTPGIFLENFENDPVNPTGPAPRRPDSWRSLIRPDRGRRGGSARSSAPGPARREVFPVTPRAPLAGELMTAA